MTAIGVPIKILHEAEGHVITLETTIGEVYRGKLNEVIFIKFFLRTITFDTFIG